MKLQSTLSNVRIFPAISIFPGNPNVVGKFVATGVCSVDDPRGYGFAGQEIRTSIIEEINIVEGYISTRNTIYKIV